MRHPNLTRRQIIALFLFLFFFPTVLLVFYWKKSLSFFFSGRRYTQWWDYSDPAPVSYAGHPITPPWTGDKNPQPSPRVAHNKKISRADKFSSFFPPSVWQINMCFFDRLYTRAALIFKLVKNVFFVWDFNCGPSVDHAWNEAPFVELRIYFQMLLSYWSWLTCHLEESLWIFFSAASLDNTFFFWRRMRMEKGESGIINTIHLEFFIFSPNGRHGCLFFFV